MRRISIDQDGAEWDICWGVLDEEAALRKEFDIAGPFRRTEAFVVFRDPIYHTETKTLPVFENSKGDLVAMAEITPSVYAAGVKK